MLPSSCYAALRDQVVKTPWVQKTKLQNASTTHSHERTRPPTHTHTDPTTHRRTDLPTHDVLQRYCSTAGHALVHAEFILVSCWDYHFLTILRHPGERADPSAGGHLFKAPARRVSHRRPFFRRCHRGLLCGAGVEPPRGRGRPSGARESQLFFGYVVTKIFSKMHLDITIITTTTTTEEHYTIRIVRT